MGFAYKGYGYVKNMLGRSAIGVGYCACGCLTPTIYCAVASIRKRRCEGSYHGDGVAAYICHVNEPVVWVKGDDLWI